MNVGVGVMHEDARLHIACGVDVQVSSSARYASTDEFAVILEIEREEGLFLAHFPYEVVQMTALLHGWHEIYDGLGSDGHVGEDPAEKRALFNHPVEVFFRSNRFGVLRCVAGRDAVRKPVLLEQRHGLCDFVVGAFAAARVGGFLRAFGAYRRNEVLHANHILAEFLVDQGCVGEAEKRAIGMLFAKSDKILFANERLAPCVDVDVDAELFALFYNRIDVVEAEIELMAVFRRPASRAAEVAGACRIEEDGPGDVALIPIPGFFLLWPGEEVRLNEKRFYQIRHDLLVHAEDFHDELIPVVLLLECRTKRFSLLREKRCGQKRLEHVHDGVGSSLRVFHDVVYEFIKRDSFHVVACGHCGRPPTCFPPCEFASRCTW